LNPQQPQDSGETTANLNAFTTVRYMPGTVSSGWVSDACVYLIKPDQRTLKGMSVHPTDPSALGHLGNGTARFIDRLLRRRQVTEVAFEARAGMLLVVLHLPNGESNPALALLNRVRALVPQEALGWAEIGEFAGLHDNEIGRIDDRTPHGCRLANMTEQLLLEAVNACLVSRTPLPH
jgi:hypothetical protein